MYKQIPVKKLTGKEAFANANGKFFTVLDFWQYAFSNLNSNILRGALAEFIIENALKDSREIVLRNPWGDWDIEFAGHKIEVKCCAYIQDWDQKDYSRIIFAGLKAKEIYWSEAVKPYKELKESAYKADLYIFALLHHKDHASLDLLDMDQWSFYILSKEELIRITNNGDSISLANLRKHDISALHFTDLRNEVERILHSC